MLIVMLASAAKTTCKSAKDVGQTCYDAIHYVKFANKYVHPERIDRYSKLLNVILSQLHLNPPIFSVNGFFELNYRWVFVIVDTTISYLVVVLYYYNKEMK